MYKKVLYAVFIATVIVLAAMLIREATASIIEGPAAQQNLVMTRLSSVPLAFTENRGQFGDKPLFKAEAGGVSFYFCPDEVAFLFVWNTDELIETDPASIGLLDNMPVRQYKPGYKKGTLLIKAQFLGANPDAEVVGIDRLPHDNNYFIGNDPSAWCTDVPNYSAILYKDIYPGIDLKYYGDGRSMKYDFIVYPGFDISRIRIRYSDVDELRVTPAGDLQIQTSFGPMFEKAPKIFQEIGGGRKKIVGRYVLLEPGIFGFALDNGFNPDYTLIIDPELIYSTYLGGGWDEHSNSIAVDASGNSYVTGCTNSSDFPLVNAYQGRSLQWDAFVTKFAPDGSSLIYSTYLGGIRDDLGKGIAVDAGGNAYIIGWTSSPDFPIENPYQTDQPFSDAFVTKITPNGNSLVYSTYLGGSLQDEGQAIVVDASGNAYMTGLTLSTDFPIVNPYQIYSGNSDVFITKLAADGSSLIYSTYLGGVSHDRSRSIAIDSDGNAYVTGETYSTDFPIENPYQTDQQYSDAFVTKLAADGSSLIYSTYLGGNDDDDARGIAVDGDGSAYITGFTYSTDFPTENPLQMDQHHTDAFVTKLEPDGRYLAFSTYLGENSGDHGDGIAVDANGNAYVTGNTGSTDFPIVNPYQANLNLGATDIFVTKFAPAGFSLIYSTYLGGSWAEDGGGIAVDSGGYAYIVGRTHSSDFPTVNPYQGDQHGPDVIVAKFGVELCENMYIPGDCNHNGIPLELVDVSTMISIYRGLVEPYHICECPPLETAFSPEADPNGNCIAFELGDVVTIIAAYWQAIPVFSCPYCPGS